MFLLVFYVTLAIAVSFVCSVFEAVLLSITPGYAEGLRSTNRRLAARTARLKKDIEKPLSAILSLNTIAHTVGAAGAGAQATHVFGDEYVGVISAVLTLLILVLSEILPKTIGALYWKKLAPYCVPGVQFIVYLTYPLVLMSRGITYFLTKDVKDKAINVDEFTALANLGVREGVLTDQEAKVVKNLFRLRDIHANDIMTPRTVIFAFDETVTPEQIVAEYDDMAFSRIPVYKDDIDRISGFVLKSDIYRYALGKGPDTPLSVFHRDILVFAEWASLYDVYTELMSKKEHIALLADEYGGTAGIITLEDIFETLIGLEIVDEKDSVSDMQQYAVQEWNRRARQIGIK